MITCSEVNFGEVDLTKSRVRISHKENPMDGFHITVCTNCGICALYCPTDAISIVNKNVHIDESLCNKCGVCIEVCPIDAIWWSPGLNAPNKCVACKACVDTCPTGALNAVEVDLKIDLGKRVTLRGV
jgi:ferredoxin